MADVAFFETLLARELAAETLGLRDDGSFFIVLDFGSFATCDYFFLPSTSDLVASSNSPNDNSF